MVYTRSNKYCLDNVYFDMTLYDWVLYVHNTICKQYEMNSFNIVVGDFGFDSYSYVIISILNNISIDEINNALDNKFQFDDLGKLALKSWVKNYKFWKNIDDENCNTIYNSYEEGINTHERNNVATLKYKNLDKYSRSNLHDIIQIILDKIDVFGLLLSFVHFNLDL